MPVIRKVHRPTIADVAAYAGVSIATVSRVVNGTGDVTEETSARVRRAIADLNYRPSSIARSLASKKTETLGLLTSDISVPFFNPILKGIEQAATEYSYGLLINCTQYHAGQPDGFHRHLGPHNTDGLLVFAGTLADSELAYLHSIGFPVVLLHQSSPDQLNIPSVTFENKDGTRRLIDHLIETHHYRRIAFLRGPENHEDSYWRERGYRESLQAHGIAQDPMLIADGDFSQDRAMEAVQGWLERGVQIDAIFGGDDEAAIGAIYALQKAGMRVPEDVAVVGFDDVHLAHYMLPPLTTVRAPVQQAGREAVHRLVSLIRGEAADPCAVLPTELIIRRSCGCQRTEEGGH